MDKRQVIYYSDELNDEFSVAKITPKVIDESWVYCHDSLWKRFTHVFWYRVVATPIAKFYTKWSFRHKTVGKEKLKPFKKQGFFLYGNHTQDIADAVLPSLITFPRTVYTIVHPNNVSMPYLGRITPSLGALPLPDDRAAYRHFLEAVERRVKENHVIMIYPEAHIWPYYTKIRPFADGSFLYPIKYGTPTFCFTNTYQKRRFSKKPKIVTYVDGPFFPDNTLSQREQKRDLRDRVHAAMTARAALSDCETIRYIKKDKEETDG